METTLKKVKDNNFELTVQVGREELLKYINLAEIQIGKEVEIDGFRKGKVPKDIIRKKVGDVFILEKALNIAIDDTFGRVVEKEKLDVLKAADLKIQENSPQKLLYTINLVLSPEVKIGDLNNIKIKKRDIEVKDKEIDDTLSAIKKSRAKFIPKEGAAEKGDKVEVDFDVTHEDLPIEGGVSRNHPLVLGEGRFIPGFEDELIGLKTGDEKSFVLDVPGDYFHKEIAGKKLNFKVKLISVQKGEQPEFNEDFIKTLGNFNDLEGLKKSVKENLLAEKKEKEKQRVRLEILDSIDGNAQIKIPESMTEERLSEMVQGFDQELHQKGMELSLYLSHLNKTEDDLRKDWRNEADRQVRYALILKKMAKEHSLRPTDIEIEEATNQLVQNIIARGGVGPENINLDALRSSVVNKLTTESALDYLEKHCSI